MKQLVITLLLAQALTIQAREVNYKRVNAQARKEYREPVRPGTNGINPFWNEFAKKFIFAPAFDFPERPLARAYLFILSDTDGKKWEMKARSPKADLSPIWEQIPGGTQLTLNVFPITKSGIETTDTLGHRTFLRDFPFCGPYNMKARPYKEAALKGMLYLHRTKIMQHWLENQTPDMSYRLNTYACKILGSSISNECLVAHYFPDEREAALRIARNIAAFLQSVSQPKDGPLACFPPTYYNGVLVNASITKQEGEDATMCMEALTVANALLDLYNETNDRQYYDWAMGITDTYRRLQRPDGSMPIKLVYSTAAPVNNRNAMLHPLLKYLRRLHNEYGIDAYEDMRQKGEKWMHNVAIRSFDMTGQFEDVSVMNLKPYQNLTNCTAAPYADYLYGKPSPTKDDLQDARDLMRLSEDQFVFWDMKPEADGIRKHATPCVFEQYKYQMSVDASACNVAGGFIACYMATGDEVALAKAVALTNAMTLVQDARSGYIPTLWQRSKSLSADSMWMNCAIHTINHLLRMSRVMEE
ncbi:MAG: LOB domain containing-protein [Bacteroidaceae bacterium]|nr:LOB domain containing-protein [Bacteroidaceae bacterium]